MATHSTKRLARRLLGALLLSLSLSGVAGAQQKVLRIGMTAADIPRTSGQPDQGFEGNRFSGIPMYDALVHWDLSKSDVASVLIPGLAVSWEIDPKNNARWIFHLRKDVKFHDGSPFNADAVVWNVQKVLDAKALQYDAAQVGATVSRMPTLKEAKKIDDYTVELTTSEPDSFLPFNLTNLFIASPVHWKALYDAIPASVPAAERSKQAWTKFASNASGTGPFKMVTMVPRERLEIEKNPAYWDEKRRPKIDKVILLPLPEANARTAALLSGQVDWIEAPSPDALDQIKSKGFVIYSNPQPHIWPWQFSVVKGSIWQDKRVRQAANLCVNRSDLKDLLGGLMGEAKGIVTKDSPWWGNPSFDVKYDPETARKLMREAGYSKDKPAAAVVQTSASGSGQMQPLPMNEFLQESLKECFFDVKLDILEWNTLFSNWRLGANDPTAKGANAINVSAAAMDPFFALVRFASSKAFPPVSVNWGYFGSQEFDDIIAKARTSFEAKERDAALAKLHARIVEEAAFLFVAHDVGPRAMSPKVRNVVQPKSWFIDIATMTMN
jgi:ABC-type transport system substrate-binding protein